MAAIILASVALGGVGMLTVAMVMTMSKRTNYLLQDEDVVRKFRKRLGRGLRRLLRARARGRKQPRRAEVFVVVKEEEDPAEVWREGWQ